MKYLIGLTGNIATGKSTVAQMLSDLGAEVIDADALVHELQRKGTQIYDEIVAEFGTGILREDGELDRTALGAIVFSDSKRLHALEAIMHPAVGVESRRRIERARADIVVYEAILLIEKSRHEICDAIWVVTAPRAAQVTRLVQHRGMSDGEAQTRVDAQTSPEQKLRHATIVIDNGGSLGATHQQVRTAYEAIPLER